MLSAEFKILTAVLLLLAACTLSSPDEPTSAPVGDPLGATASVEPPPFRIVTRTPFGTPPAAVTSASGNLPVSPLPIGGNSSVFPTTDPNLVVSQEHE